jgi:hypothetical protein
MRLAIASRGSRFRFLLDMLHSCGNPFPLCVTQRVTVLRTKKESRLESQAVSEGCSMPSSHHYLDENFYSLLI